MHVTNNLIYIYMMAQKCYDKCNIMDQRYIFVGYHSLELIYVAGKICYIHKLATLMTSLSLLSSSLKSVL